MIRFLNIDRWKRKLKWRVQRNQLLLRLYHFLRPPASDSHAHLIRTYAQTAGSETIMFLQIGAHEGGLHDPLDHHIRLHGWRGLFVEPQSEEIGALRSSYAAFSGLNFAETAVSSVAGQRKFYRIRPQADLPLWVSQLSSFYREVPASILKDYPEAEIIEETVESRTIADLQRAYNLHDVHILLIDTEGHDGEILRSVDLNNCRPDLILFEHYHLTDPDLENTLAYLGEAGYQFWKKQANTLAVLSPELRQQYPGVWQKAKKISHD